MKSGLAMLLAAGCGACNGGGASDATVDIDNGSCGDQLRFTGEYVDWDSNDAAFCGVFEARLQIQGDGAMDTTAPNGRFDMCVPPSGVTLIDITPGPSNSPCAQPPSPYQVAGIGVANPAVIRAGGFWSGRGFTAARRATVTFDPAKAHVIVHVNGTARAVSIAAAHAQPEAMPANTWGPGDVGHEVYFPNVEVGSGTTMLSVTGGAIGTGEIPLVAGKVTNVSVIAN